MTKGSSGTFLSFAYGSNMLLRQILKRCPSASFLGVASLPGYVHRWHKRSRDGSGKCDVVASADGAAIVYGVPYRIAESERRALDAAEGIGHGYESTSLVVRLEGAEHPASVYTATAIDPSLRPYSWYKALVVNGAREHGLPSWYLASLEEAETTMDPDTARHRRKMALINAAGDGRP